jgi:beta-N-acetylhexosaminidase
VLLIALVGAGALVLRGDDDGSTDVPEAGAQRTAERRTSFLARMIPPAPEARPRGPQVPRSVTDLVRRLPLERKAAQLFLLGFTGRDLTAPVYAQFRRLDLGGLVIDTGNYTNPQTLNSLAGEAVLISQQEKHVPPWVLAGQEGGDFNVFPDLPPATAAADLPDAAQAGREAAEAGSTLKPLGISGVLAPVADVGVPDGPAVGARAFSDDPQKVAGYVRAVVRAYRSKRVFSAALHFPGLGTGSQATEEGPSNVGQSLEALRSRDLVPFRAAIEAGVPGIVIGHGLYVLDDFVTPASLSSEVATKLLRRELKFRGIAITDDLADPPITALGSVPDAAVAAVKAGADMLYISGPAGDQQAAYVAVLRAARRGEISRKRLNQALLRILTVKRRYGLIR